MFIDIHLVDNRYLRTLKSYVSHPDSRSDPKGGSEPSPGCETIYWDSLPIFFLRVELVLMGIQTISVKKKNHLHIQKNYHRSGVHQNLYTYTESHLHIQNYTFTFTYQSAKPTCSEPLLVSWPSSMRKFSDVFSCTYTD